MAMQRAVLAAAALVLAVMLSRVSATACDVNGACNPNPCEHTASGSTCACDLQTNTTVCTCAVGWIGSTCHNRNYVLSAAAYAPVSNAAITTGAGYTLVASAGDDAMLGPINLGFSFPFMGSSYPSFYLCTNGWLSFDVSSEPGPTYFTRALPSSGVPPHTAVFFWFVDLDPTLCSDCMSYSCVGTAPNRVFVISWIGVPYASDSGHSVTGQILLYETSGRIELQYTHGDVTGFPKVVSAGIEDQTGSYAYAVPGLNNQAPAATVINTAYGFQPTPNTCASNPCMNGAQCIPDVSIYTCVCVAGWSGAQCQHNIDECASSPCANGGTCTDGLNSFSCGCTAGYTGYGCLQLANECLSEPCVHGGTCTDLFSAFTCQCAAGYSGVTCETDINECASSPCLNGGTCSDAVNGFTCHCPAGIYGVNCDNHNECLSFPCLNGGNCTDALNGFTCACTAGWSGPTCSVNIDECASIPCQHGAQCIDGLASWRCVCTAGWVGTSCQTNVDECASAPCQNGGTCVDQDASYRCVCPFGWVGLQCTITGTCPPFYMTNGTHCLANSTGLALFPGIIPPIAPYPPFIISARLTVDLSFIHVTFDSMTDRGGINVIGLTACTSLFDATSVALLGTGPTCVWLAPNVISIGVGALATVQPGNLITLLASAHIRSADGFSFPTPEQSIGVQIPTQVLPTEAAIIGPATAVGSCNGFSLDGGSSGGSGGRALTYVWSLIAPASYSYSDPNTPTAPPTPSLAEFNAAASVLSGRSGAPIVTFAANELTQNRQFTFQLQVSNWIGTTDLSPPYTVYLLNVPAPGLIINGPAVRAVATGTDVLISTQLIPDACNPSQRILFSWSQLFTHPVNSATWPSTLSSTPIASSVRRFLKPLYIRARELAPGNIGLAVTLYSATATFVNVTASLVLVVAPARITVPILPLRRIGGSTAVTLSASSLFGLPPVTAPDTLSSLYSFAWTCVLAAGGAPCFSASRASAILTATPTISFPPSDVVAQNPAAAALSDVAITVTCTITPTTVGSPLLVTASSQQLVVSSLTVPPVFIATLPGDSFASDAKLIVPSSLSAISTDSILWVCTSGNLDLTDPNSVASSPTAPTLIVLPVADRANIQYSFDLFAAPSAGSSSPTTSARPNRVLFTKSAAAATSPKAAPGATVDPPTIPVGSVSITTVAPPTGGLCTAVAAGTGGTSVGIGLNTSFTLSCANWASASVPLQYSFSILLPVDGVPTPVALTSFSVVNSVSVRLPPGTASAGYGQVIRAFIRDNGGATRYVDVACTVLPPVTSNVFVFMQELISGPLSLALSIGDPDETAQLILGVVSLLRSSRADRDPAGPAIADAELAIRADLRSQLLGGIVALADIAFPTVDANRVQIQLLGQIVAVTDEIAPSLRYFVVLSSQLQVALVQGLPIDSAVAAGSVLTNVLSTLGPNVTNTLAADMTNSFLENLKLVTAGVANGLLVNENPTVVPNVKMTLTVARFTAGLVPTTLVIGGSAAAASDPSAPGFVVPPTLFTAQNVAVDSVMDVSFLYYPTNLYSYANGYRKDTISPTLSLTYLNRSTTLVGSSGSSGSGSSGTATASEPTEVAITGLDCSTEVKIILPHDDDAASALNGGPNPVDGSIAVPECRFWNVATQNYSTAGCYVDQTYANYTVCKCSHLTTFALSSSRYVPSITIVDRTDFAALTSDSLTNHPAALISVAVLVFVFVVLWIGSHHHNVRRWRQKQRDAVVAEEASVAAAASISPTSRSVSSTFDLSHHEHPEHSYSKRVKLYMQHNLITEHEWLSPWFVDPEEHLSSTELLWCLFVKVLTGFVVAALFYGEHGYWSFPVIVVASTLAKIPPYYVFHELLRCIRERNRMWRRRQRAANAAAAGNKLQSGPSLLSLDVMNSPLAHSTILSPKNEPQTEMTAVAPIANGGASPPPPAAGSLEAASNAAAVSHGPAGPMDDGNATPNRVVKVGPTSPPGSVGVAPPIGSPTGSLDASSERALRAVLADSVADGSAPHHVSRSSLVVPTHTRFRSLSPLTASGKNVFPPVAAGVNADAAAALGLTPESQNRSIAAAAATSTPPRAMPLPSVTINTHTHGSGEGGNVKHVRMPSAVEYIYGSHDAKSPRSGAAAASQVPLDAAAAAAEAATANGSATGKGIQWTASPVLGPRAFTPAGSPPPAGAATTSATPGAVAANGSPLVHQTPEQKSPLIAGGAASPAAVVPLSPDNVIVASPGVASKRGGVPRAPAAWADNESCYDKCSRKFCCSVSDGIPAVGADGKPIPTPLRNPNDRKCVVACMDCDCYTRYCAPLSPSGATWSRVVVYSLLVCYAIGISVLLLAYGAQLTYIADHNSTTLPDGTCERTPPAVLTQSEANDLVNDWLLASFAAVIASALIIEPIKLGVWAVVGSWWTHRKHHQIVCCDGCCKCTCC